MVINKLYKKAYQLFFLKVLYIGVFIHLSVLVYANENIYDDLLNKESSNTDSLKNISNVESIQLKSLLLPTPTGTIGPSSRFGNSISIDKSFAIVGADNYSYGIGAAHIYEFENGMWTHQQTLFSPDRFEDNQFGNSVSIYGNRAVVGASQQYQSSRKGTVFIFDLIDDKWIQTATLQASDGQLGDKFGLSVNLYNDRLMVSSVVNGIYVFDYKDDVWIESDKIFPNDAVNGTTVFNFGSSLSQEENIVLVGSYRSEVNQIRTGSAYIFQYDGQSWIQISKLMSEDGKHADNFGISVSLNRDKALIGASNIANSSLGAAYVFEKINNNWIQSAKLTGSAEPSNYSSFGSSVSLVDNIAIIGAKNDGTNGFSSGSAYFFKNNGDNWIEKDIIFASNSHELAAFGSFVYATNDKVLIGAPHSNVNGLHQNGSVYSYTIIEDELIENDKIIAKEGATYDQFGYSLNIHKNIAIIGAPFDNSYSGAAYIYRLIENKWVLSKKLNNPDNVRSYGFSTSIFNNTAVISSIGSDNENFGSLKIFIYKYLNADWVLSESILIPDTGYFNGSLPKSILSIFEDRLLIGSSINLAFVYKFNEDSWEHESTLFPLDGVKDGLFGLAVSLYGNRALIGARESAYIFDFDDYSWTQTAKIQPQDGEFGDSFGYSVSLGEDRALIGSFYDDEIDSDEFYSGSAYIFDFDGQLWNQTKKLIPPQLITHGHFGSSVSLSQNKALIGMDMHKSGLTPRIGKAYLYKLNQINWSLENEYSSNLGIKNDLFGKSLSLSGNNVLIGAALANFSGFKSGSAYFHKYCYANDCIFTNGFE